MKNGPYELVVAPEDYPGFKYRGRYVYEHHLVWWKKTGQLVPDGHVVHHKNGKHRDNRFSNLELKTVADHSSEHAEPAPTTTMVCAWCNEEFEREVRDVRSKKKNGQRNFFCCRSHQVKHQWEGRKHNPQ